MGLYCLTLQIKHLDFYHDIFCIMYGLINITVDDRLGSNERQYFIWVICSQIFKFRRNIFYHVLP